MEKVAGPFMISADTEDMPGRVKLLFVTFHEEIVVADKAFEARSFRLLDQRSPHAEKLRQVVA